MILLTLLILLILPLLIDPTDPLFDPASLPLALHEDALEDNQANEIILVLHRLS